MKKSIQKILVIILIIFSNYTITTKAADSSTAGIMLPKTQQQTNQQNKLLSVKNQTDSTLICVDSGVQGRRCGITAINFCKRYPEALNCNTINKTVAPSKDGQ